VLVGPASPLVSVVRLVAERLRPPPREHRLGRPGLPDPEEAAIPPQADHVALDERIVRSVFFFQAEDGIRAATVTGVQTCALPISKLDLAKEAAHLVVDLLDERNEVGVMSWDTEFVWDAPVRPARDRQAIHHAIATIKAGGGTDGYPALKDAYAVLFDRPALLKHVIFLSDGQMTRGDFQGLLRRMAKDKITVSTVAIGKDADVQLMVDIAKWGRGRFYYTEDSQTIPRIFTLETQLASKASLIEQPFKPQLTSPNHEAMQ